MLVEPLFFNRRRSLGQHGKANRLRQAFTKHAYGERSTRFNLPRRIERYSIYTLRVRAHVLPPLPKRGKRSPCGVAPMRGPCCTASRSNCQICRSGCWALPSLLAGVCCARAAPAQIRECRGVCECACSGGSPPSLVERRKASALAQRANVRESSQLLRGIRESLT